MYLNFKSVYHVHKPFTLLQVLFSFCNELLTEGSLELKEAGLDLNDDFRPRSESWSNDL